MIDEDDLQQVEMEDVDIDYENDGDVNFEPQQIAAVAVQP